MASNPRRLRRMDQSRLYRERFEKISFPTKKHVIPEEPETMDEKEARLKQMQCLRRKSLNWLGMP